MEASRVDPIEDRVFNLERKVCKHTKLNWCSSVGRVVFSTIRKQEKNIRSLKREVFH